jgi:hypothetical protein
MSRKLTASDRNTLIRLASTMEKGSEERKAILAGLSKSARARGPIYVDVLEDRWNDLHDFERALDGAAQEYDVAASYSGGKGRKDAQKMLKMINDLKEALEAISSGSDGLLSKILEAEMEFVKKHGTPYEYAEAQREAMYPR